MGGQFLNHRKLYISNFRLLLSLEPSEKTVGVSGDGGEWLAVKSDSNVLLRPRLSA